jgi:hypothetical protein
MLYLSIHRADLSEAAISRMPELIGEISNTLQPLLQPTLAAPASILGVTANDLRAPSEPDVFQLSRTVFDGELFTDCRRSLENA